MRIILAAAMVALAPAVANAHEAHKGHGGHGDHGGHGGHAAEIEGGKPGKAADATRTVTIVATDTAFAPKAVAVKAGETVRFVVRNDGKLVHELTIGTKAMQAAHQSEMLALAASGVLEADKVDRAKLGTHAHGNNVLLEPGQSGEVVWTFDKTANLEFGCNVPGHYDAGMKGDFKIE